MGMGTLCSVETISAWKMKRLADGWVDSRMDQYEKERR